MSNERKALIIGCAGYKQNVSIDTIAPGAEAIAEQLSVNYDGSTNFEVRLLTDQNPDEPPYKDEKELKGIIETFLSEGKKEETGVFCFIGHGKEKTFVTEASLVFAGPRTDAFDIEIEMAWLMQRIQQSKFGNLFIIIESCHSGSFGAELDVPLRDGVCILTSCSAKQVACGKMSEVYTKYPLFIGFLKEALAGKAADPITGIISFSSVYNYVSQQLGQKQSPVLRCNVSEYVPLKQHKVSFDQEILYVIHRFFMLDDRDQWPENSSWLRAYTRRYILGPHDQERFERALPFLLSNRYVMQQEKGMNAFGELRPFYMLTSKGVRLWDMVESKYYSDSLK